MDDADRARRYQQEINDRAAAARKPEPVLPANGLCHNCRFPFRGEQRFCDAACSQEWEKDKEGGLV